MKSSLLLLLIVCFAVFSPAQDFHAGFARADITPEKPVRLAGYASRNKPHEGVEQRIHVKALALKDTAGTTTLIVTADTIGTPRWFNDRLADRIERELQVPRAHFLFACSHSHSTPVIAGCLEDMYGLQGGELEAVKAYTDMFLQKSFEVAQAALKNLEPVKLTLGHGQAAFAANRRAFGPKGVGFGVNPTGVMDHDVPVIRIEGAGGALKGVLLGYACHCTTPGADYKVCGDWSGFTQEYLELTYPGATAMVVIGCGADQNPNPRNGHLYCRQHGLALAGTVARALNEPMRPLRGPVRAAFDRVELPLDTLPPKEEFAKKAADKNPSIARFGKRYFDMLERGEKPMSSYPCPVQVLRFGNDFTLVALGGEVVVDYSHRLRRELPDDKVWVAGYCNDVFAYLPSMRILTEGGYEAEFNLIYYGIPARFAPAVEDIVVRKVVEMVKGLR
jgi:neutral ceramidase